VWIAVAGVAALAVVLAVVIVLVGRGKEEPPAEPPTPVVVTKTVAPPSPTVTAVPPPGSTPFAQALPTAVGAYALTRAAEFPNWADAGAIEAYALTYSDGETEIRVTAGQWPTAEAAASAMEAAPLSTDTSGDKWQNETAIFTVDAPPEAAEAFAAQFPM
jgi:hypothetical protein